MAGITRFLLPLLLISCSVSSVRSIRCWTCHSKTDPHCGEPFDSKTVPLTDCDSVAPPHLDATGITGSPIKATFCRKTMQRIEDKWRTIRSCGYLNDSSSQDDDCYTTGRSVRIIHCSCYHDSCNTSASVVASVLLLIASLLALTGWQRVSQ